MEVSTRKTIKSEAKEWYNELIQKDIDALERAKVDDIRKHNILDFLKNTGSIFTGAYFHYRNVSKEAMFEKVSQREQN